MQDQTTDLDDGFGHWLAGFADGEGSFNIQRRGRARHGLGQRSDFRMVFVLRLRADDKPILDEIQCRTRLGKVHGPVTPSGAVNPQFAWVVNTRADCAALADIFARFPLRAKKARDCEIWRQAVAEWLSVVSPHAGRKRGPVRDWSRIAWLADSLRRVRGYRPPDGRGPNLPILPDDPQIELWSD